MLPYAKICDLTRLPIGFKEVNAREAGSVVVEAASVVAASVVDATID